MIKVKISKQQIIENIKNNKKKVWIIIAICLIVGIVVGAIDSKHYMSYNLNSDAYYESTINLPDNGKDVGYYYKTIYNIKQKADYLHIYISYLDQIEMSNESKAVIVSFKDHLENYEKEADVLYNILNSRPISIEGKKNEAIVYYDNINSELSKKVEKIETDLENILDGVYTDSFKESKEDEAYTRIRNINANIELINTQKQLLIEANTDTIYKNTILGDSIIEENIIALNALIEEYNSLIQVISENESYYIAHNKYIVVDYLTEVGIAENIDDNEFMSEKINQAVVYARSVAGKEPIKERFMAILTFFLLLGIVMSCIICVLYDRNQIYDKEK